MANELKHAIVGPELTRSEYEAITAHILDGAVLGDLIWFDGTNLKRFPLGADGTFVGAVAGTLAYGAPSIAPPTIVRTAVDYIVLVTDDYVLVDTSAGPITITLPAVSASSKPVTIKKITNDANVMTIVPNGTDTVENDAAGAATLGGGRASFTLLPDTGPAPDNWSIV